MNTTSQQLDFIVAVTPCCLFDPITSLLTSATTTAIENDEFDKYLPTLCKVVVDGNIVDKSLENNWDEFERFVNSI